MESAFLTFILFPSFVVYSSHFGTTDWHDMVVTREGMSTTLVCTDTTVRGNVTINWTVKSFDKLGKLKLLPLATGRNVFTGSASKTLMRLADNNFQESGVFSLTFSPRMEDIGLYSCEISQHESKLKEKIILLVILTVTISPAPIVSQYTTLRLIATVNPDFAASKITWVAPDGNLMRSEKIPSKGTVAKLPLIQINDSGAYICTVHPWGNSNSAVFPFSVNVIVEVDKVANFNNVTHGPSISTATHAHTSFTLACPSVQGDYVRLYRQPPDKTKPESMKLLFQYDRWRGYRLIKSEKIKLAGPPYNAEAGSFSFQLTPEVKDGGLYICDVYLDDAAFSQWTQLSVMKVKTRHLISKLELICLYSERSQVYNAVWKHNNTEQTMSSSLGSITTTVSLPITSDTAGNYTCTLKLKNGQTIWATQAVTLPRENVTTESVSVTAPSLLPSLSALLLLVPLVAAAVGVLLWRQKRISDRGIEQSLSVQSGEAENIYENPEDIRQAPSQGSVYMDLKPREADDVYKELERYEQCQS